ncbi:unnamed protein product, partial [Brassica rapa]
SHLTPGHQAHKITTNSALTTPLEVPAPTTFTHSHEVQSISCSKIENNLPMLAVEETAHPQSHVMEEIPSKEIILETPQASENEQSIGHYSPIANNFQQFHMEQDLSPLTHGRDDGLGEVGETSGYNITRGGRLIKPTQKIQDMEWKNVRGKGKRGRRGRGNHVH